MKLQHTALTIALIPAAAQAAVIKVDLNDAASAPATWNTVSGGQTDITVVDSTGSDDGVTVSTGFGDSSNTSSEGAYNAGFWDEVARDYVFTFSASDTVTIKGLQVSETYTLKLISSSNSASREATFTVNGNAGDGAAPFNGVTFHAGDDGFDLGREMTFSGISPDSNGEIEILATKTNGDAIIFSGFTIEGNFVPEPGSFALLGLGGLCVLRRRRS